MDREEPDQHFDAVVVGAGFAGMYALHRLRGLGLSVRVIEAGADVGGTWYWNRYPGARCDVPSMEYSYSFSPELEQEWEWTEVMAGQPEILTYAQHVADRFDLRRDIDFGTRVVSAVRDDAANTWTITTDSGDRLTATWCIMATGCLSAVNVPDIEGIDDFEGEVLHTGRWPEPPPDLARRRVGIIGTGSSGVQSIPVLAEQAGCLHVFQRTAVYTFPAGNKPLRADVQQAYKESYAEVREMQRTSPVGFSGFRPLKKEGGQAPVSAVIDTDGARHRPRIVDATPDERREAFERYGYGVFQAFGDVYKDLTANEIACDLYRDRLFELIDDPETAEALAPRGYPLGCKRQVIDSGYYPTFNRADVTLVDLRREPLVRVTTTGIETTEREIELDVIVLATGFDAMTGALNRIDVRGRDGLALRDAWSTGPRTYLGLQVAGFPNLFTITGPGSPSVLANMIVAIEHHVDWIADTITHVRSGGHATIEPTPDAQDAWVDHVNEVAQGTMYVAPTCASWYLGANIEGKPNVFMPYVGGLGRYRARCEEVVANGYEGFAIR